MVSRLATSREVKARELVERGGILKLGKHGNLWAVPSESEPGQGYMVFIPDAIAGEQPSCGCRDWQERKPEGGCKHMLAVQMVADRQAKIERGRKAATELFPF